eukprot:8931652-Lingulodinium_polyedra.AAC.1
MSDDGNDGYSDGDYSDEDYSDGDYSDPDEFVHEDYSSKDYWEEEDELDGALYGGKSAAAARAAHGPRHVRLGVVETCE